MQIYLWKNFSKRINSTKQPDDSAKTIKNVVLKDNCSLDAPVFILHDDIDVSYNYCAFEFSYYYITDIVFISNNLYEIYTKRDSLATYKTNIGNYNCFIERSTSNYNLMIPDPNISNQSNIVDYNMALDDISSWNTNGCYILRTSSGNAGALGVSTYVLTLSQLKDALLYCTGDLLDEITDEFLKAAFNPMQYILDIKWYPFAPDTISTEKVAIIKFGQYKYTAETAIFRIITDVGLAFTETIQFPTSRYYNDFRDFSPSFTSYQLYLPGVGLVSVAPSDITSTLRASYYVDYATGELSVILHKPSGAYVAEFTGKLGININVSQLSINSNQLLGGLAGGISQGIAGDYLGAASSIVSASQSLMQPTSSNISIGAGGIILLKNLYKIALVRTTYGSAEKPNTVGLPCCKNLTINTLSGFVKCGNASLDISGHPQEKEEINNYLNSGFYYE